MWTTNICIVSLLVYLLLICIVLQLLFEQLLSRFNLDYKLSISPVTLFLTSLRRGLARDGYPKNPVVSSFNFNFFKLWPELMGVVRYCFRSDAVVIGWCFLYIYCSHQFAAINYWYINDSVIEKPWLSICLWLTFLHFV